MSFNGGGPRGDDEYVGLMGIITYWDMSRHPTKGDDLLRKLGKAGKTRGGAIVGVLEPAGRKIWADGLTNTARKQKNTIFPHDPDNHVVRYYDGPEQSEFGAWSTRLVADHARHASLRHHRSTQVTDATSDQSWGWLSDLIRVTEPQGGAPVFDWSLKYNAAGFLPDLSEEIRTGGKPSRGVLAAPIFRNIGHVTDGGHIGQWSHVFTFKSPGGVPVATQGPPGGPMFGPDVATGPGGGPVGGTASEDKEVIEPPIPAGDGGRPTAAFELMLRGDVKFRFPQGPGRFVQEKLPKTPPESGEPRLVHVTCLAELAPVEDPGLDSATDPNTNVTKIPKDVMARKIVGYVKVPAPGSGCSTRYDYSYHSPPPPPSSSSSGSGVATGGGPTAPAMGENPDGSNSIGEDTNPEQEPIEGDPDTEAPAPETGAPTEAAQHGHTGDTYPDQDPAATSELIDQLEAEASAAWDAANPQ